MSIKYRERPTINVGIGYFMGQNITTSPYKKNISGFVYVRFYFHFYVKKAVDIRPQPKSQHPQPLSRRDGAQKNLVKTFTYFQKRVNIGYLTLEKAMHLIN